MKKHAITLGVSLLVLTSSSPLIVHADTMTNTVNSEVSAVPASAPTPAPADNNSPAESTKKLTTENKKLATTTSIHQDELPQTSESKSSVPLTLLGFTLLIGLFFSK